MTIQLDRINKRFGEQMVVNRVTLEIQDGELFVLLGSSGSGKSTILRLIAGLLQPDVGSIFLHGRDVTNLPPQKRDTGFVFQNYAIFRHMTVAENVEYGLKIRRVTSRERQQRCADLLELVGLGGLGGRLPAQLSGGQRQRVALARALAYKPTVLLLDEPFGALDLKIRTQLRHSLREIQKQLKVTSILVTHDQDEAFELADRIGIIDHGRLVETGTSADLYYRPKSEFVATFLGGGNVIVGRAEQNEIKLGSHRLPLPASAPDHEEGTPVRILFRAETVRIQETPFEPASALYPIGKGRLLERTFCGPIERLRFELQNLQGVRPVSPVLRYGQRFATVLATRSSMGSDADLNLGAERWIAISSFHVLEPSNLRFLLWTDDSEDYRALLGPAKQITQASHGQLTLLRVTPPDGSLETDRGAAERLALSLAPEGDLHVVTASRQGSLEEEFVSEVQLSHPDYLLLGRPSASNPGAEKRLAALVRHLIDNTGVPIMLGLKPLQSIQRILVCTAAGEPGKNDVRVAARLARHIKAFTTVVHVLRAAATAEERRRVERHLASAAALLNLYSIPNEAKTISEPRLKNILAAAEAGNYDLIVLGASDAFLSRARREHDLAADIIGGTDKAVLLVPPLD